MLIVCFWERYTELFPLPRVAGVLENSFFLSSLQELLFVFTANQWLRLKILRYWFLGKIQNFQIRSFWDMAHHNSFLTPPPQNKVCYFKELLPPGAFCTILLYIDRLSAYKMSQKVCTLLWEMREHSILAKRRAHIRRWPITQDWMRAKCRFACLP